MVHPMQGVTRKGAHMPRAVVCVGVPAQIEPSTWENNEGKTITQIRFVLRHPALAVSGALQFEATQADVIDQIESAAAAERSVEIAAVPRRVDYEKDGEQKHFFKLKALGVVTV